MKLWLDKIYNQRDPLWANKILGFNPANSVYTIGNYGCLVSTLAIYLTAINHNETPDSLNEKLKKVNGFVTGTGLFIWSSLNKVYADVSMFYESPRWDGVDTPKEAIESARDLIRNGYFVIFEVDFDPTLAGEQMHFVGGCGVDESGEIIVADPWTGELLPLSTYGNPTNSVFSFKAYSPVLPEEVIAAPYEEWKLVAWRFGRVFIAGALGALTVTVLNTGLNLELGQAIKYIGIAILTGGITALGKFLRDKYGINLDSPVNKLPF